MTSKEFAAAVKL